MIGILFNDALSVTRLCSVDDRMMNWKRFGRKRSRPVLRYYPGIRLEGLKKNTKSSLSIACRQESNSGLPEYEVEVLTTTTTFGAANERQQMTAAGEKLERHLRPQSHGTPECLVLEMFVIATTVGKLLSQSDLWFLRCASGLLLG
jgi:hypothetical protein